MSKFICPGMYVVNIVDNKHGKVITVDRRTGTAIVRDDSSFWSGQVRNFTVISYKEVE